MILICIILNARKVDTVDTSLGMSGKGSHRCKNSQKYKFSLQNSEILIVTDCFSRIHVIATSHHLTLITVLGNCYFRKALGKKKKLREYFPLVSGKKETHCLNQKSEKDSKKSFYR